MVQGTGYSSSSRGLTLAAQAIKTVFTWNGVSSGCFDRMRQTMPVMCGAAKLFPVVSTYCLLFQATSRSMPGAPNYTGGLGL